MKYFFLFLLFLMAKVHIVNAQVGNFQFINSLTTLEGNTFGNNNIRQGYSSLAEYGYSKRSSFGTLLNVARIDSVYSNGMTGYSIFGPELFYRYKFLIKGKNGLVLHNAIKFPGSYDEDKNLGLMPKQWDYEVRLLFLHNFKEGLVLSVVHDSTPYFIRTELAYRQRFNNQFSEVRTAIIAGMHITNKFGILLQNNIAWNIANDGYASSSLNNTYSNFDFTKDANNMLTVSLLYHYNGHTAFQVGYVKRIHGNAPIYDNSGITIGIWNALL